MLENNSNYSKSIRPILYPTEDTTLRFVSKDHIGEITLDNENGYFKFYPGIAPEELEGYVTLETKQTITGHKIFEEVDISLIDSFIVFEDTLSNPPFGDEELYAVIGRKIIGVPGDRDSLITVNDHIVFTPETLVAGDGISLQWESDMLPKKYIISSTALQHVDLTTIYSTDEIVVTANSGGQDTHIQSATESTAGVLSADDKKKVNKLIIDGDINPLRSGQLFLNNEGEYTEVLVYDSGIIEKVDTSHNEVVLSRMRQFSATDFLSEHIIVDSKYGSTLIDVRIEPGAIAKVKVFNYNLAEDSTPEIYVYRVYSLIYKAYTVEVKYHSPNTVDDDKIRFRVLNSVSSFADELAIDRGDAFENNDNRNTDVIKVWDSENAPLADIVINSGTGTNVLADNGTYIDISGLGSGDMTKAVYDPGNIAADVFDYTNLVNKPNVPATTDDLTQGSTNLYYSDVLVSGNADVAANTFSRHSHANIALLNSLTTAGDGTKYLNDRGNYVAVSSGTGNAEWGSIGGLITNQTDLYTNFPSKESNAQITGNWTFLNDLTVNGDIHNWFNNLWEYDETHQVLRCTVNLASEGEVTAYAQTDYDPGSLWDNMPLATATAIGGVYAQAESVGYKDGIAITAEGFLKIDPTYGEADTKAIWGNITGTLSTQTDLQNALDAKASSTHTHIITEVDGLTDALTNRPTKTENVTILGNWVFSTGLTINGDTAIDGNLTVTGNIDAEGEVTAYSASDSRLKQNVMELTDGLEIINKLRPVSFKWNNKAVELNTIKNTEDKQLGLIAQEVEEVVPEVVGTVYKDYKAIDYEKLVPYLIKAVQELSKEVEELKSR